MLKNDIIFDIIFHIWCLEQGRSDGSLTRLLAPLRHNLKQDGGRSWPSTAGTRLAIGNFVMREFGAEPWCVRNSAASGFTATTRTAAALKGFHEPAVCRCRLTVA
jgi:hypothetical protein